METPPTPYLINGAFLEHARVSLGKQYEAMMEKSYVEQRDHGYWITGTRISLDSLSTPSSAVRRQSIQRAFPLLTLEEFYGAITFYLAHAQEIDAYLAQAEAGFASRRVP